MFVFTSCVSSFSCWLNATLYVGWANMTSSKGHEGKWKVKSTKTGYCTLSAKPTRLLSFCRLLIGKGHNQSALTIPHLCTMQWNLITNVNIISTGGFVYVYGFDFQAIHNEISEQIWNSCFNRAIFYFLPGSCCSKRIAEEISRI